MDIRYILCNKEDKSVSYFRFPFDDTLRKQWLLFCNIEDDAVRPSDRLCSDHFLDADVRRDAKRIVLNPQAVPRVHSVRANVLFEESLFTAANSYTPHNTMCRTDALEVDEDEETSHVERENGKCLINDVQILFVSSANKDRLYINHLEEHVQPTSSTTTFSDIASSDHDYFSSFWTLSPYIDEVVKYIGGFVVRKLMKRDICEICSQFLISTRKAPDYNILAIIKNRGNLIFPSSDVIMIIKASEKIIRQYKCLFFEQRNIQQFLILKIFNDVCHLVFNETAMTEHIKHQEVLDNHKTELIKNIIKPYVQLRLFHEVKCEAEKNKSQFIRQKYTKLILHKNQ